MGVAHVDAPGDGATHRRGDVCRAHIANVLDTAFSPSDRRLLLDHAHIDERAGGQETRVIQTRRTACAQGSMTT